MGEIRVESKPLPNEGQIEGRPTLMAIYAAKQDAQALLNALRGAGYPQSDISIYYRPDGTDQVIDAITDQIAAGQSLNEAELQKMDPDKMQTVVLLHPDAAQLTQVQNALNSVGTAEMLYSGETVAIGRPGGVERRDSTT